MTFQRQLSVRHIGPVFALTLFACTPTRVRTTPPACCTPIDTLVDVGGHRLHFKVWERKSDITLVVEAGGSSDLSSWETVPAKVAERLASLDRMSERVATTSAPRELSAPAIRRGVPLYNDGQPEATSAIYEVAARAVVALGTEIPSRVRRRLGQGLRDAEREDALDERARTLRRALDDAGRGLAGREMTATGRH